MTKLETVEVFTSPWEAHIVKGRLESEGIPVFIAHEHHIWANWVFSHTLGGVKVQVTSDNLENAKKILESLETGEYEKALKEEVPDVQDNICPRCGSRQFKSRFPIDLIILVILTLGLLGVIFPPRKENHTCLKCGQKWKY